MKTNSYIAALSAAAVVSVGGMAIAPATAVAPGNNGTVKVLPDGDIDAIPNNHPHVGCTFQLEWYGFDAGVVSTVTFEEQAPTTGVGMTVSGDTTAQLDNDPGNGAGNGGFDGTESYTLSFTGAPHPQQGYHVKLTINTPDSNGADVKHKVFWVEGCAPTTPPVTPETPPATPETPPVTPPSTPETPTTPTTPATTPTTPATTPATPATTPATPAPSVSVSPSTGETDSPEGGGGNGGANNGAGGAGGTEVLNEQGSGGVTVHGQSSQGQGSTVAGQQQSAPTTTVSGQQAVPTSINAGLSAHDDDNLVLPVSMAAFGALLGLLALLMRRRSA